MEIEMQSTLSELKERPKEYILRTFGEYVGSKKIDGDLISQFQVNIDSEWMSNIPTLCLDDSINLTSQPVLCQYKGFVVNTMENQLYVAAYASQNGNVSFLKYLEDVEINEQEEDFDPNTNAVFSDRLILNIRKVPGLNPHMQSYITEGHTYKDYIIRVVEYQNKSSKINQLIEVVGLAYFDHQLKEIRIHSFSLKYITLKDLYKDSISIDTLEYTEYAKLRERAKDSFYYLLQTNDETLVEYLIMCLFSASKVRNSGKLLGYLPLNIYGVNSNNKFAEKLKNILGNVLPCLTEYIVTVNSLNVDPLVPTFNLDSEELSVSCLQVPDQSLILFDEQNLSNGILKETGLKNLNFIGGIIQKQVHVLDFPYNPGVEIETNCQVLVLSEGKSIFSNTYDLLIPLSLNEQLINSSFIQLDSLKESQAYQLLREYFKLGINILSSHNFSSDFIIDEEVSTKLQSDFVQLRKENTASFIADDFSQWINLSKIYAISAGRNFLCFNDYEIVKKLDIERKSRSKPISKSTN